MWLLDKLFGKNRRKPPEEVVVPEVVFLREQDGEPERDFKSTILPILAADKNIRRAYLAQAAHGDQHGLNIALCLRSKGDPSEARCAVGKVFAKTFRTTEHLDIILVSEDQEMKLAKVCCPFFAAEPVEDEDSFVGHCENCGASVAAVMCSGMWSGISPGGEHIGGGFYSAVCPRCKTLLEAHRGVSSENESVPRVWHAK